MAPQTTHSNRVSSVRVLGVHSDGKVSLRIHIASSPKISMLAHNPSSTTLLRAGAGVNPAVA